MVAPTADAHIVVVWSDGTETTYTIPEANKGTIEITADTIKFLGYQGTNGGLSVNYTLFTDKMRSYYTVGI